MQWFIIEILIGIHYTNRGTFKTWLLTFFSDTFTVLPTKSIISWNEGYLQPLHMGSLCTNYKKEPFLSVVCTPILAFRCLCIVEYGCRISLVYKTHIWSFLWTNRWTKQKHLWLMLYIWLFQTKLVIVVTHSLIILVFFSS